MDIHECVNQTTFLNMGSGGKAVHTFEVSGLPDASNMDGRFLVIEAQLIDGTSPGSYEIQIWNIANADHFTNLDDDFDATVFKETGINPATPCRRDETDFGKRPYINKDTSGLKNRMYVGIKLTGGGGDTDMGIKVFVVTRELI